MPGNAFPSFWQLHTPSKVNSTSGNRLAQRLKLFTGYNNTSLSQGMPRLAVLTTVG